MGKSFDEDVKGRVSVLTREQRVERLGEARAAGLDGSVDWQERAFMGGVVLLVCVMVWVVFLFT